MDRVSEGDEEDKRENQIEKILNKWSTPKHTTTYNATYSQRNDEQRLEKNTSEYNILQTLPLFHPFAFTALKLLFLL